MEKHQKAYFYVLLSVLCWSTVATAFKLALRHLNFIQLLFYSCWTTLIVLFVILIVNKKQHLLLKQSSLDWLKSAFLGALNPFLYYLILFKAYELLLAQEAQILNYTWGVMLALLAIPILKEKLSLKTFIALMISFVGVIILSTKGNITSFQLTHPFGVFLALFSSLIWAGFWLFNVRDKRDPIIKLLSGFIFGTFYITITVIILGEPIIPPAFGMAAAVYVGFFEMGIAFVFWLKALSYAKKPGTMGNFIFLSPFLSLIFIHFILNEDIHISSIIGLLFIIGGIFFQKFKGAESKKVKSG